MRQGFHRDTHCSAGARRSLRPVRPRPLCTGLGLADCLKGYLVAMT